LMVVTIALGILIESLQPGFEDRVPGMGDILRNIIGALVGIVFLLPSRKTIPRKQLLAIQALVVLLVLMQMVPIISALLDENLAKKQFPLLSGFETSSEIKRWKGDVTFDIQSQIKKSGESALKVMLDTETYSGVGLKYFPGDWEGFRYFQFSVYNPQRDKLNLTCRIHDWQHTQGKQVYADRFNRSFPVLQGWNTITIKLEDVKTAPENRSMDIQRIQGVSIFAVRLLQPRTIFIDDVTLK
jgi:hypothetical protein